MNTRFANVVIQLVLEVGTPSAQYFSDRDIKKKKKKKRWKRGAYVQ